MCCTAWCLQYFSPRQMSDCREEWFSRSEQGRMEWLRNYLMAVDSPEGFNFRVNKKPVCQRCFMLMYDIKIKKFNRCRMLATTSVIPIHGNFGSSRTSAERIRFKGWFEQYVAHIGDPSPDRHTIQLPCYLTKLDVYHHYLEEFPDCHISEGTFYSVWNERRDVVIPPFTRLGKCDKCIELTALKQKNTQDLRRSQYQATKHKHTFQIKQERDLLQRLRTEAISMPHDKTSIISDGMTSPPLPMFGVPFPKSGAAIKPIQIHIHGLINHGNGTQELYYYLDHWKRTSNLTLTITLLHLRAILSDPNRVRSTSIHFHVDNATKELKNKTMFAFAADIIRRGWYHEVSCYNPLPFHFLMFYISPNDDHRLHSLPLPKR